MCGKHRDARTASIMPLTYAIPDLHGRSDLLDRALATIAAHAAGRQATIVTLGDYVDKGPDSRGVIARLRTGAGASARLVMLKGNHDAMMVAALRDPARMDYWLARGGGAVLASYGGEAADVPPHDIDWLDARPLVHSDRHRIYVHAGLDAALPLAQQDAATLLFKRYPPGEDTGFGALHVVHGHDAHADGPLLYNHRSNLDTDAWRSGRLVIGVFDDDKEGGPIDLIEILGPPAG